MSKVQMFFALYTIIAIFFGIKSYIRGEVLYEIDVKVNKYYFLEGDLDHNMVLLCETRNGSNCLNIKRISAQYKNYLIGETEDKKYFYINILDNNEKEFNISKEKLREKFPKRIKFILSQKYMNQNGESFGISALDTVAINSIIKTFLCIPVILLLIKFKLYPKSWNEK